MTWNARRWVGYALAFVAPIAVLAAEAGPAIAQTRPALVRDVDNPALQPQRIGIFTSLASGENYKLTLGPVVPAGKQLVIENASVWALTNDTVKVTGIWLKPVGPSVYILLDPTTNEFRPLTGGLTLAAYNRTLKAYFSPGEQLQVEVFTEGTGGLQLVNVYLQGYYVNVP